MTSGPLNIKTMASVLIYVIACAIPDVTARDMTMAPVSVDL